MPLALLALTISAFAIGTTEFVIVGLVPTIAEQLSISLPSAGLLVSIYALGVAIGAPVLTALTGKLPRKQLLLALMVLFTIGNLLAWQAPGYITLVIARLLTGLAPRGLLLNRVDDCYQPGTKRESGLGYCHHVWWPDRCASDRCSTWDLYRSALWLA
ncbi:Inner membrane transport protein ydhP [Kluyvera cryocrescens]|uniref:Inner membrane transport protein ydhP n=1 Tax=Kluyvera cryocrescens TaxID=580 RepID=A0A485BJF3_KLUCR|nr:Inner membrane transport protein ydhP [Kluyvera cryocrescens]